MQNNPCAREYIPSFPIAPPPPHPQGKHQIVQNSKCRRGEKFRRQAGNRDKSPSVRPLKIFRVLGLGVSAGAAPV